MLHSFQLYLMESKEAEIEAAVNEVLQQGALHAQVEEIGEV